MSSNTENRSFRVKDTGSQPFASRIFGRSAAVATHHYLSAQAAIEVLRSGGNAIDAAIAATLVEGVVNPQMHTLGGEIAILISTKTGRFVINGNMVAPERATVSEFKIRGFSKIPPEGVLAAGVPGAMSALIEAARRFGRMSFRDLSTAALSLCRHGFPAHAGLLRQHRFGLADNFLKILSDWPGTAAVYLPNRQMPPEGSLIQNLALADVFDTLNAIESDTDGTREQGLSAVAREFYSGSIAHEIVAYAKLNDGLLTYSDLSSFRARLERPVTLEFYGAEILKCGPWTQGPALLQTLSILKNFDIRALGHNTAAYLHVLIEAIKLAFADRDQYYGDPTKVAVPLNELLSEQYGAARSELIGDSANCELRPGDPLRMRQLLSPAHQIGGSGWGPGTVQIDVMDKEGNSVAFTPSGAWIRQAEVVPALGFPLGMRLSNSELGPESHPNTVGPGRQPRTTISPTMVCRGDKTWLAFGSMGGDQQDQWQLQMLLNRLVFGMSLNEAIEAPKFSSEHFPGFFYPHDSRTNHVRIEESVGASVLGELRALGHELDVGPAWSEGFICATERHSTGILEAAVDWRGSKSEIFPACALAY